MTGGVGRRTRSRPSAAATVTVGMPVWNGEEFIEGGIDSLLGQTFGDLTLVISDNGSTDRTQAICEAYARRDPRVHYQRLDRNAGLHANFARLIDQARGPYFMWAGHDDRWDPTYVERMVSVLDAHPSVVLAGCNAASIDQSGVEWRRFNNVGVYAHDGGIAARARRFMAEPPGGGHATLIFALMRTPVIQRLGFDPPGPIRDFNRGYYAMDLLTLFRLIFEGEFHVESDVLFWRRDVLWSAVEWAAHNEQARDTVRLANTVSAVRAAHGYYADLRRIIGATALDASKRRALVRATYREELRFHPATLGRLSGRVRRRRRAERAGDLTPRRETPWSHEADREATH